MAYIYRRGKYWWVGFTQGGRCIQKSLKVTSKPAARVLLGEYQTIEARYYNHSHALSIKKNIEEIVEEYAGLKARKKTQNWYKWCGGKFVDFCEGLGIENIGDVYVDTIDRWYNECKRAGREREKKLREEDEGRRVQADPGGAASMLRGIKAIFNHAVKRHYITESPARDVKADKPTKKIFRDLSFEEVDKLLEEARKKGSPYYAMFATAYYAGLREGELIYLKPADVDFEQNYIDVKSKPENLIKDHQERRIPLNAKLKKILKKHKPGRKWMFETSPGAPRKHHLTRELRRAGTWAEIETRGLNMRVLRETFGSHLRRRGVDLALISEYMGHSSVDVTRRHYAHIRLEQTRKEIDKL